MVESDPEFRTILRHAVREHMEVMRNELVSLDKSNQALSEGFQIGLERIDELKERVDMLEKLVERIVEQQSAGQRPALPPPEE